MLVWTDTEHWIYCGILQIRAGREALEASGMCGYGTSVQRKSFGTTVFLWHLPFQDARGQPGLMNTRMCSKERQGPTRPQAPALGEDLSELGKNKPKEPYHDPTHPPALPSIKLVFGKTL